MSLLHEGFEAKKFDNRVVERNVTRGVVTSDDVLKSVRELVDDSENAAWIDVEALYQEVREENRSRSS
jgi:hypothetical protein